LTKSKNGLISTNYASKKYNISRSTIAYWMKKLSCFEGSARKRKANKSKNQKQRCDLVSILQSRKI